MPGTVIEISDRIVRKDISFMDPHRKFIDTELSNKNIKIISLHEAFKSDICRNNGET